jgi:phosphate transport system protein
MEHTALTHEIQLAKDEILMLGSMVEQAVFRSVRALKENDMEVSQIVFENDHKINRKRYDLERAVIGVIATQQPTARDLRVLASVLDLCTELERIGDYAKGISVINLRSEGLGSNKLLNDLDYMSEKAVDMLHRSLTAFSDEDSESARLIANEDDWIDILYEQIYIEVIDLIVENASNIERANYILWAAHNLERLADRVTNICERTVFINTGELGELSDTLGHRERR